MQKDLMGISLTDATRRKGPRPRSLGAKNYSQDFREMVVAETNDPSRSIAEVARSYGLNAKWVSHWRKEAAARSQPSNATGSAFARSSPFVGLLPVEMVDTDGNCMPCGPVSKDR